MTDEPRRDPPASIKRAVRQRCGFGCVYCGIPVIQYDHMLGWAKVKRHVAEEITLLCANHHTMKTTGLITEQQVIEQDKIPHNVVNESSKPMALFFGNEQDAVMELGGNLFTHDDHLAPIVIDGTSLFTFTRAEDGGGWLLQISLFNELNLRVMNVRDSELVVTDDAWDMRVEGNTLTINAGAGQVSARIRFEPPNRVVVDRAELLCNGVHLSVNKQDIKVNNVGARLRSNAIHAPVGMFVGGKWGPYERVPGGTVVQVNRYRKVGY